MVGLIVWFGCWFVLIVLVVVYSSNLRLFCCAVLWFCFAILRLYCCLLLRWFGWIFCFGFVDFESLFWVADLLNSVA